MKLLFLMAVAVAVPMAGAPGEDDPAIATNINSRYTVEKVSVSGFGNSLISAPLRTELDQVVGEKLDQSRLEKLADRMRKELHVSEVAVKVTKGNAPDHVLVTFEVKSKQQRFDLNVAKFLYDAEQGWSGEGTATTRIGGNSFTLGLVSDGDALLERFAGLKARYQRDKLGTKWLGLRFEFDTFHDEWNTATLEALSASPATSAVEPVTYRDRQVFTPEARLYLAEPLELDFGVRFARYRPSTPGANTESSNAVVSTLRYHQRWGSAGDLQQQELEGSYSFDAATRVFESDPVYTRHMARARYKFHHGHNSVQVGFLAGRIYGQTPLFDLLRAGRFFHLARVEQIRSGSAGRISRAPWLDRLSVSLPPGFLRHRRSVGRPARAGAEAVPGHRFKEGQFSTRRGVSGSGRAGGPHVFCRNEFLMRSIRAWWLVVAFLSGMVLAMGVEELILSAHDNRLEFSTPVHFLSGQPLAARLRNAAEVPFDIQTKLWSGKNKTLFREAEDRFVISFDIWEHDLLRGCASDPPKDQDSPHRCRRREMVHGPDDARYHRPLQFRADMDAARHPRRGAGSRRKRLRTR